MEFAVSYSTPFFGVDPDRVVGYARHAEECGFQALYLPEHIAVYPVATVGTHEISPALPYHHPVVLAKRLATVDSGEFFAFEDLCSFPKPLGVTHLPCTWAVRAGPPRAGPDVGVTGTSPAAC